MGTPGRRPLLLAAAVVVVGLAGPAGAVPAERGHGAAPGTRSTPPASAPPTAAPPTPTPPPTPPAPGRPGATWPTTVDPIARVDWSDVTIRLPRHPDPAAGCLAGPVRLRDGISRGAGPVLFVGAPFLPPRYGDLTGDGRPEAVLYAECRFVRDSSSDGVGQLLVVHRRGDGTLVGLGWAGPRGALYPEFWITDRILYVDAQPWHTDWGYRLGAALAYRWHSAGLVAVDSGYPGLGPAPAPGGPDPGPAAGIDLGPDSGPVVAALGCPGGRLALDARPADPMSGPFVVGGRAARDGFVYSFLPTRHPDGVPHLLELFGDGRRSLAVWVTCHAAGAAPDDVQRGVGTRGQGIVILDPAPDGALHATDLVPVDPAHGISEWTFDRGRLTVHAFPRDGGGSVEPQVWRWTGGHFTR